MEESLDLYRYTKKRFQLEENDIDTYSPLTLAYIGDAVYEMIIRTVIVSEGNSQVKKYHKKSSSYVKASAQADMIRLLSDELTEHEKAVYKRGRNAKSVSTPKNATMADYKMATGFEALIGYLYLTEQSERMMELIKTGIMGKGIKEQQNSQSSS